MNFAHIILSVLLIGSSYKATFTEKPFSVCLSWMEKNYTAEQIIKHRPKGFEVMYADSLFPYLEKPDDSVLRNIKFKHDHKGLKAIKFSVSYAEFETVKKELQELGFSLFLSPPSEEATLKIYRNNKLNRTAVIIVPENKKLVTCFLHREMGNYIAW